MMYHRCVPSLLSYNRVGINCVRRVHRARRYPCAIARGSAAGTKRSSEPNPGRFWRVTRTRTAGPGKSRVRVGVPTEIPSGHPRYSLFYTSSRLITVLKCELYMTSHQRQ
ncbi:hypothetical protein BDZ89DRAFT_367396 [Hymenopellis radicata]|nr:hypothetical protein BDZ89DRAFT_367396 [Hymenopellis radicata]